LPSWAELIHRTEVEGIPTVLIVTSSAFPDSRALARTLVEEAAKRHLGDRFGIAELSAERDPDQVARLNVRSFPMIVALGVGEGARLEVVGAHRGSLSLDGLEGWMLGLGLISGGTETTSAKGAMRSDSAIVRAQMPSSQGPSPQFPSAPPPPKMSVPYTPAVPPPVIEREVVVQPPAPTEEVEIVREVVAPPREYVTREVVVEEAPRRRYVQVEEAAPRNLLTRPVAPAREVAAPREVVVREVASPREVLVREVAAPREVVVREVAAPREVLVREVTAPREVMVREVAAPRQVAVREAPAQQPVYVVTRPGPFRRLVGALGREMQEIGAPRIQVDVERNFRITRNVTTTEVAPPAPPPVYTPPPPPAYAPSPQAPTPYPTPQASPQAGSSGLFHGLLGH
jgi:hypothetical protein